MENLLALKVTQGMFLHGSQDRASRTALLLLQVPNTAEKKVLVNNTDVRYLPT